MSSSSLGTIKVDLKLLQNKHLQRISKCNRYRYTPLSKWTRNVLSFKEQRNPHAWEKESEMKSSLCMRIAKQVKGKVW
jgi:hypothetical protein